MSGLNAPFGARCFLTFNSRFRLLRRPLCLNAPFGARLAGLPENVACNSTDSPSSFEVRTLNFCGFLVLVDTCSRKLHARFRVLGALWRAKGRGASNEIRFNAPFGARCFLTAQRRAQHAEDLESLNASFGARCFLTHGLRAARCHSAWS